MPPDEHLTLPAEIRAALPPLVQSYLAFLDGQAAQLATQVAPLQAAVMKLEVQLAEAQAWAKQHSGTSSRPPSIDPPSAPARPKRKPSGRQKGAQKGHPGHTRTQLPDARISGRVEHRPAQGPACTLPLDATAPTEGEPIRVQVWEVPPVAAEGITVRLSSALPAL